MTQESVAIGGRQRKVRVTTSSYDIPHEWSNQHEELVSEGAYPLTKPTSRSFQIIFSLYLF